MAWYPYSMWVQVGKMASAFQRASIGSPTGPDGLPGDPAAEAERLALQAMRHVEARAQLSMQPDTLHGTPSLVGETATAVADVDVTPAL